MSKFSSPVREGGWPRASVPRPGLEALVSRVIDLCCCKKVILLLLKAQEWVERVGRVRIGPPKACRSALPLAGGPP